MRGKPIHKKIFTFFIIFSSYFLFLTVFYIITRNTNIQAIRERLRANAAAASLAINPEDIKYVHTEKDRNTIHYKNIKTTLERLASLHPDIRYIYTMRKDEKGNIRFVVDGEDTQDINGDGIITQDEEAAEIGELYPNPPPDLLKGFFTPSVDKHITEDKWGKYISGYAPIRDNENKVVGIIGIDMLASTIEEKLSFLKVVYLIGLVISIVIAFILTNIIYFFNK